MAPDDTNGYAAMSNLQAEPATSLPIFNVERVQLQFNIAANFVAAQVANNLLVLALATGRILRIDLGNPSDIEDVDLPKKPAEIGLIRRMFLDPSASHLIITTTLRENYYLHSQSRQPKHLSRLRGVSIECVAWDPSLPSHNTREVLVGATDGNIYEIYVEQQSEFYRRDGGYTLQIFKIPDGSVTGLWIDAIPNRPDLRRVVVASHTRLVHLIGKTGGRGREGSGPIYADLFRNENPVVHDIAGASAAAPSVLAITPDPSTPEPNQQTENSYAWLSSQGVFCGPLPKSPPESSLGDRIFGESKLIPRSFFPETMSARGSRKLIQDPIVSLALTRWHILALVEGRVIAINRLDGSQVNDQAVLEPGQTALGLVTDLKKNTFWLFTSQDIFELVANDEERDIWKIMLKQQRYDEALKYAQDASQKDTVATATGDHMFAKGQYLDAAGTWGKSSKAFEEVCLSMIDKGLEDALKDYLLTKITTFKRSSTMQRTMIATWVVQIFMAKLNALDDTVATKAELLEDTDTKGAREKLAKTQREYQDFISKHKSDLDVQTVYELVGSHDREEELLVFANAIQDYNFVLSYWVQREHWAEALTVLNKQTDPESFHKYSNVLMTHAPAGLVEILMRQNGVDPQKLIPALLAYNENAEGPLNQNQAVRYLGFVINNHPDVPSSLHNTLISIMASHPSPSETALLSYLESQPIPTPYDADFALRLCIQHKRIQSCVHIYSSMGQYLQAVELALQHSDTDLAAIVADRPDGNNKLRKRLWLLVAEKKIQQDAGIRSAISFLKRCELLKIEDLIPFFPDFVVIDDFRDEICTALEDYSRHIDELKTEMDTSARTADQIVAEIAALDSRFAIVEPGEKCWICGLPVLSRQFFVFPCQHAFHSDCLGKKVLDRAGLAKRKKIRDLQVEVGRGLAAGPKREKAIRELDGLVAEACVLCGDCGTESVDEPFVREGDDRGEWAV